MHQNKPKGGLLRKKKHWFMFKIRVFTTPSYCWFVAPDGGPTESQSHTQCPTFLAGEHARW